MFSRFLSLCVFAVVVSGCARESREFVDPAASGVARANPESLSSLQPGPPTSLDTANRRLVSASPYENNAYHIAQGKQLYTTFNCNGCHGMGGGGIGPPLIDHVWIYGGDSKSVVETITRGRPNGMPAFGSKVGQQQIWQLASYVRSMTGQVPNDAAPGRGDHMHAMTPEVMVPQELP
jgi:cytochrome c oxidase cbb3-type subunit 3